jgi:hypothetical protein
MIKLYWQEIALNELHLAKMHMEGAKAFPKQKELYLSLCRDSIKLAYRYWNLGQ